MAKLRSSNIEPSTGTTLALGASGDATLISSDSIKANTWQDLGGNSIWVSDGAGTLSSVNSGLAGGGYTLILAQTFTGQGTVSFTANIDSTYDEYVFVMTDIATSSNSASLQVNFHDSGGTALIKTTTTFNAAHAENDGLAELIYNTGPDLAQSTNAQQLSDGNVGNGSDECLAGTVHLYSPSSTTYVKHFISTTQFYENGDQSWNFFAAGYVNTTTAVAQVSFTTNSGTFDGTIQMYGVA